MSAEKDKPNAAPQRAALLRRAGIAGVLIVALLIGLGWYEREQAAPPPVASTDVPPPLPELPELPAPPRGAPPMPSAEEVEAMAAAEAGEGAAGDEASPELTAAPVVVAPDARTDETPPAVSGAPRLVLGGDDKAGRSPPVAAAKAPAPRAATETAPRAVTPEPAPASAEGAYLIQLGVFSAPGNAEALAGRVDQIGIAAHIQSRVVVGPFKSRNEADEARRKLQASGLGKGLVVRSD